MSSKSFVIFGSLALLSWLGISFFNDLKPTANSAIEGISEAPAAELMPAVHSESEKPSSIAIAP